MKPIYRPDIDGLRAIAVLSVFLFHLGVPGIPGGYVGVDIFFVISGFVITSSVYSEVKQGHFSILGFYDRRLRRIVPALVVVLVASLAAGYWFLFPDDYSRLATQTAYAAAGLSNFFFYRSSGYFDAAAASQPLLHTWSLGVEEQFYVFWPLLLAGLAGFASGRWIRPALIIIIAASFVACIWLTTTNQPFAFYMLPTRAWELGLGALLVFLPPFTGLRAVMAPIVGLALIAASFATLTEASAFPGWIAAVPCTGAALLIWRRTAPVPTDRLLGFKPVVWVGLISYSLYLWHWPAIFFAKQIWPGGLSALHLIGIFVTCVITATLSYRYIETPIRVWKPRFWRSVTAGVAASAAMAVIAAGVIASKGVPSRFPADAVAIAKYKYDYNADYRVGTCFLRQEQSVRDLKQRECLLRGKNTALLWGDSFAAHYTAGLKPLLESAGFTFAQANASLCPPLIGRDVANRPYCKEFNGAVLEWVRKYRPNLVILSATWLLDPSSLSALDDTLTALSKINGVTVIVLGQSPLYRGSVPTIIAERWMRGDRSEFSKTSTASQSFTSDGYVRPLVEKRANAIFVSVADAACPGNQCKMFADGVPYHWDFGHFTRAGSEFYSASIFPVIERIAAQKMGMALN